MNPEEIDPDEHQGTPSDVPTAKVDQELELNDDGELILPDYLVGYVGDFTIRTPNVTGEMETSEHGLGETSDLLGSVPEAGDWHGDLEAGMMAISTDEHPEKVFRITDGDQ